MALTQENRTDSAWKFYWERGKMLRDTVTIPSVLCLLFMMICKQRGLLSLTVLQVLNNTYIVLTKARVLGSFFFPVTEWKSNHRHGNLNENDAANFAIDAEP